MFSFATKHLSDSVGSGFMASRTMGSTDSQVLVKPVLRKYGIRFSYQIDRRNGSSVSTVGTVFPGKYDELSDEPTYAHHKFAGWFDGIASDPGILIEFSGYSDTAYGDPIGPLSTSMRFTVPYTMSNNWTGYALEGEVAPVDIGDVMSREYVICDPDTGGNLVMLFHYGSEHFSLQGIDTSSPSVGSYFDANHTGYVDVSALAAVTPSEVFPEDALVYDTPVIYAEWDDPVPVSFDATTNGGQMPSGWVSPEYFIGDPFGTLPAPTKSGEVFLGWFTSGGARVTESTTVSASNTSLTARYMAVTWATTYSCTTTSSYKNTGIYAASRYSSSSPIVVDWGDGGTDVVYGNIDKLSHTYSSVGTFTVKISDNISTFRPSYNDATWYGTTSHNRYTFKKVLTLSSKVTQLSAYAFYYCSAMTDAIVPSGATSIPTYCFYYCQSLKSSTVQLPSTVTSIGTYAFYYCSSSGFSSITIPAACTAVNGYAFNYCNYLHPVFESSTSALTLGNYAFSRCGYNGSAFTIDLSPRKITSIPSYCFYYCYYLKGITWPQGVTSIGTYAFRSCFYYASSTGTVEIPEGVTSIGTYAFGYCMYLTAVTLPSTLTNLNNYAFSNCTRMATINSNRSTAPTVASYTFGNTTANYTGRNSYSAGTNRLYVPSGATGYTSSYWGSVLLDSTKCGFTLEEVQ